MRIIYLLLLLPILLLSLTVTVPPASASSPPGPFQQVATTSMPAGFGELLNAYERSLTSESLETPKKALQVLAVPHTEWN